MFRLPAYKLAARGPLLITKRMVHAITSKSEFEDIIKSGTVIADFWAEWCGPCKGIAPIYEKLDAKYDSIKFVKVNFEENQDLASEYDVTALPTFVLFKDGKAVDVVKGANPQNLQKVLEANK